VVVANELGYFVIHSKLDELCVEYLAVEEEHTSTKEVPINGLELGYIEFFFIVPLQ